MATPNVDPPTQDPPTTDTPSRSEKLKEECKQLFGCWDKLAETFKKNKGEDGTVFVLITAPHTRLLLHKININSSVAF